MKESKTSDDSPSAYVIHNFNSEELIDFLKREGPNESPLFLMHTAHYMGYCGVTLSHFVRLAKFLQKYQVNITLGKINSFKNSLPIDLTPEKVPAFVFYPAHRLVLLCTIIIYIFIFFTDIIYGILRIINYYIMFFKFQSFRSPNFSTWGRRHGSVSPPIRPK